MTIEIRKSFAKMPELKYNEELSQEKGLAVWTYCKDLGLIYCDAEAVSDSKYGQERLNGDMYIYEFVEGGRGLDWFGTDDEAEFVAWLNARTKYLAIEHLKQMQSEKMRELSDLTDLINRLEVE